VRVPAFEFTVFVEGVDLLSEEAENATAYLGVDVGGLVAESVDDDLSRDDLDRVDRLLRYRGSDCFANASFGREDDVQYVTFRLDEAEDTAVQWATAMLTYALPGLRVVSVRPGPYGELRIK
jgi:hypothetical protein